MEQVNSYNERREGTAALWSSYLGIAVDADDVKNMMVLHNLSSGIKRREAVPFVEPPLIGKFWDFIESIVEDREFNLARTIDEYVLHMASVERVWLATGHSLLEFKQIKRVLPLSKKRYVFVQKNKFVSHPLTGKTVRCWIFKTNE